MVRKFVSLLFCANNSNDGVVVKDVKANAVNAADILSNVKDIRRVKTLGDTIKLDLQSSSIGPK